MNKEQIEVGDRRKFGDQGTNLRNFWEKSNIQLRLISELMEKSKSRPISKSPPQYWTPNHEVQKPTFNTNFAKFYKENYKSYSRKMYFMYIFLKTSIKVWLWNISDKTLLLKFGFMNTAMWSPKPNSEPNFWPKRKTETEFGAEFLTKKNNRIQPRSKFRRRPPLAVDPYTVCPVWSDFSGLVWILTFSQNLVWIRSEFTPKVRKILKIISLSWFY